jgi:hypothetical protein
MLANPCGEIFIAHLTGSDGENRNKKFTIGRAECLVVQFQRCFEQDGSDAFVAVEKRMVLDYPERVQSGQVRSARIRIRGGVLRSR